ncbi:RNA helicase [Sarracenia purpurea var. burkii]
MSTRGRYPPGIGGGSGGRGGGVNANPNFQPRNFQQQQQQQQQYVQRSPIQNHQQFHSQQHQQWLRRNQLGAEPSVVEIEKTVQLEAVDSRYGYVDLLPTVIFSCRTEESNEANACVDSNSQGFMIVLNYRCIDDVPVVMEISISHLLKESISKFMIMRLKGSSNVFGSVTKSCSVPDG